MVQMIEEFLLLNLSRFASESFAISYVTISIPGDALDFGDLPINIVRTSSTSNGTGDIGIIAGGEGLNELDDIYKINISSLGNASDFGNLGPFRNELASTSNDTNDRGIIAGGLNGGNFYNYIDYITISSPSNATDFGDLTVKRRSLKATSNGSNDIGVFSGGMIVGDEEVDTIDFVTISSPGNATDFGNLVVERVRHMSTSNGVL
jgi:hypothetical protein